MLHEYKGYMLGSMDRVRGYILSQAYTKHWLHWVISLNIKTFKRVSQDYPYLYMYPFFKQPYIKPIILSNIVSILQFEIIKAILIICDISQTMFLQLAPSIPSIIVWYTKRIYPSIPSILLCIMYVHVLCLECYTIIIILVSVLSIISIVNVTCYQEYYMHMSPNTQYII